MFLTYNAIKTWNDIPENIKNNPKLLPGELTGIKIGRLIKGAVLDILATTAVFSAGNLYGHTKGFNEGNEDSAKIYHSLIRKDKGTARFVQDSQNRAGMNTKQDSTIGPETVTSQAKLEKCSRDTLYCITDKAMSLKSI